MSGIERIAAERKRQVEQEGWTLEQDDELDSEELIDAAICYAALDNLPDVSIPVTWPFEREWWKPSDDPIRNLEKAGALIAAEIDRLERKKSK